MTMPANIEDQSSVASEWAAILWEEEAADQRDQYAAIRPELSAAWSKLKAAISSALGIWYDELAVALARTSIQERRSVPLRLACHYAGLAFGRASL